MLQKAARMQAAVLISRTAPSSLAIQLAEQAGITLIGYARRDRFNVYTHPNRILSSAPPAGDVSHPPPQVDHSLAPPVDS
jgi:FdhD protein